MIKTRHLLALTILAPGIALAQDTGVQGKVGTLGLGLELTHEFTERFGARVGFNAFSYEFDDTHSEIDYEFDLGLSSGSALVDFRPTGGGFRLTGGALMNGNEIDAVASSDNTYDIGGTTYNLSDVGNLNGKIDFDSFAPYLGLGYSTPASASGNLGVTFDVGVAFQGTPGVKMEASGLIADDPTFQQDLAAEEQELQDDLDNFELYPVVSLGLQYRF